MIDDENITGSNFIPLANYFISPQNMELTSIFNFLPYWMYLLIAVLSLWYLYNTKDFDYWKKQGLPGPKPLFLIGTMGSIWKHEIHKLNLERLKKYGLVYGTFEGSLPMLSVSDPELIKQIMVKDAPVFTNRRPFEILTKYKLTKNMLFFMNDEEWKNTRSILSPTYTSGKLKQMVQLVEECVQTLIGSLDAQAESGEPVDFAKIFPVLTLEVIASVAFGMKIDCIQNPDNEFVVKAQKAFQTNPKLIFFLIVLGPILKLLPQLAEHPLNYFASIASRAIDMRIQNQEKSRRDFLQILLEAEAPHEQPAKEREESTNKTLTRDEIISQIVLFILAGHETTANALKSMAYELAINQNIQEKLIEEVDEIMSECKGKPSYDNIESLKYLEMVVSETLRKYPPSITTDRRCSVDGYNLNGITLRKDTIVNIPIYNIHHNPEFYPEPNKFDPERFSPENNAARNPYIYLPFGAGPRNCIAMRFALMELKIVMIQMLYTYRLQTCQETEFPLTFKLGSLLMQPTSVILKLQKRIDQPHFN